VAKLTRREEQGSVPRGKPHLRHRNDVVAVTSTARSSPAPRDELSEQGSATLVVANKNGSFDLERIGIRSTFYHRLRRWVEDVALNAPEEILANALANPSVRGGLVSLLTDTAADVDTSRLTELQNRALTRGLAAKEALRERAGGFVPTAWVSEHLKISRQAVDKRRKAGKLLAVQAADGTFAYPLCQFTDEGVVPGLEDALAALQVESPWERLSALVNPAPALGGRSVLDVLGTARSEKERAQALAVLREFLE
jgi:hypothetical protein